MGASYNNKAESVSLNALRGQTMMRLAGVQQRLESKGIGMEFARSASRTSPSNDAGLMGGLILSSLVAGAFSSFMGMHIQMGESALGVSFNHAVVSGALESLSLYRDQQSDGYKGRKLNDYPEGRRNAALLEGKISKKYNLVSGQHNNRLAFNAEADLACMHEILDLLDKLENTGVKKICLDKNEPAYDALKQAVKAISAKNGVRSFFRPMKMAI